MIQMKNQLKYGNLYQVKFNFQYISENKNLSPNFIDYFKKTLYVLLKI